MKRRFVPTLAKRNLRADWFATLCAVAGVALGTATVNVVLILDLNTRAWESKRWTTNPDLHVDLRRTVQLIGIQSDGEIARAEDAKEETHEDYQVMRSAIRLGSLSAYLVGALIVFFTFRVVIEQRRREIALIRSLGATRRQVASVFMFEAALIGTAGAVAGLMLAPPLTVAAATAGITTTGRSTLGWISFPWKTMLFVSFIGTVTALLGLWRPLKDILELDVARTLQPHFVGREEAIARRPKGVALIAFPFMALLYVLIRPFFYEVLPSLTFFVLESGLVCAGFLSMLVLVPQLVGVLGRVVGKLVPRGPRAERLLTLRRVERAGHEIAWAVSGVMLVFALLLGLHVVTRALKLEAIDWASSTVRDNAYVFTRSGRATLPKETLARLPDDVLRVPFSGRTPWPNTLLAVDEGALARFAETSSEGALAIARRLGPGRVILSRMMSRRFGIEEGDTLRVESLSRTADLEVVGVTDQVGYMPMIGPYRNSKTYALVSSADFDLVAPYTGPIGAGVALRAPFEASESFWKTALAPASERLGIRVEVGTDFERDRVRETDRDFAIFDVILFLTAVLAAIGIANNLVLSSHVRRREIALYRVLGMKVQQIRRLFLIEGVFIGLLGGVMAVVLGIPLGFSAIGALEVISAFEVRFDLPTRYALFTVIGALAVSVASAIYPAARASRLSAAESVHYE